MSGSLGDWVPCTLADLTPGIEYGLTTSAVPDGEGPRFLRITDIVGGHIDWLGVPACEVSDRDFDKYRLRTGDVVIARTGASVGCSGYVQNPPDAVFASYLVRFRATSECDPRFVYYCLQSPAWRHFVDGIASGKSAQPNASASALGGFEILLPPLPEQRAIAELLGALDDKVESNRRIQDRLAELRRLLLLDLVDGATRSSKWVEVELSTVLTSRIEKIGDTEAPEYSATIRGLELRSGNFKKSLSATSSKNRQRLGG